MNSGMRVLVTALLLGGGAWCWPVLAEEDSGNVLTALGGTSISGYAGAASHWQTRTAVREPAIGVVAIRPGAQEGKRISRSPGSGAFKFFRAGDISRPLTVYFQVDGTAVASVDYVASVNGKPFPLVSAEPPPIWTVALWNWTYYGAVPFNWGIMAGGTVMSTDSSVVVGPPISIPTPPVFVRALDWIVIPAGRRTATLTIDPVDDRWREMAESVIVSISSDGSPYPSRASVQIIDND